MAFGDLKRAFSGSGAAIASTTTTITASAGISVAVGDVVAALFTERVSLTVTAAVDDLGNSYTAQNAGTDMGNPTGRAFYFIITSAGTLNSISFATPTTGSNDYWAGAEVIEGPFSGIGSNPANSSAATGTGPAVSPPVADSVIISWGSAANGAAFGVATCATGYTVDVQGFSGSGGANTTGGGLARLVVASTASNTPVWSSTAATPNGPIGGMSFSKSTASSSGVTTYGKMFLVFY